MVVESQLWYRLYALQVLGSGQRRSTADASNWRGVSTARVAAMLPRCGWSSKNWELRETVACRLETIEYDAQDWSSMCEATTPSPVWCLIYLQAHSAHWEGGCSRCASPGPRGPWGPIAKTDLAKKTIYIFILTNVHVLSFFSILYVLYHFLRFIVRAYVFDVWLKNSCFFIKKKKELFYFEKKNR